MCVVIDPGALSKVFDSSNLEHIQFKPVKDWVLDGNGSVVFGGTKYIEELGPGRYRALFLELKKIDRAVTTNTAAVDDRASYLKTLVADEDFDDEHLVAIVGVTGCCVICTADDRFLPYLRRKDLYPPGIKVPFLYQNLHHKGHCCERRIAAICPKRVVPASRRLGRKSKKPKGRPKIKFGT
jgi:hypothetical protein